MSCLQSDPLLADPKIDTIYTHSGSLISVGHIPSLSTISQGCPQWRYRYPVEEGMVSKTMHHGWIAFQWTILQI